MRDRWDGDVHYYDFHLTDIRSLRPEIDAIEVAAAFVYPPGGAASPTVGIVMALSAQEQRRGTTLEKAVAAAREILPTLVEHHRPEVTSLLENRNYVYSWNG